MELLTDSIKEPTHPTRSHTAAGQYIPSTEQIDSVKKNKQAGREATIFHQSNLSLNTQTYTLPQLPEIPSLQSLLCVNANRKVNITKLEMCDVCTCK